MTFEAEPLESWLARASSCRFFAVLISRLSAEGDVDYRVYLLFALLGHFRL